jgi:ubiquinone/menaquinone biosynthesis C-methylase UbiE|tara:strand:- start:407 stop:673 length:267 start_codon:yes stop_codon:yes gene_type:complete
MSIDLDKFDFGFTAVDEDELEVVQKQSQKLESTSGKAEELEDKLNKLYNSILPLLSNLKANPEKDYIYWPKRTEKVEAFEDLIAEIVK